MAQNIYDDDAFFAAYATLPRSRDGLSAAPEWPAIQSMLPELAGRRVLDLGCGYGWFSRHAAEQGADLVVGVDLSNKMLDVARALDAPTSATNIVYRRVDLDEFDPAAFSDVVANHRFDLVYSSLTFHYVDDFDRLMASVSQVVTDDATLVCSVEHPVATAPRHPQSVEVDDVGRIWPLDSYFDEGERVTDWLAPGVIKQHRTIESYVRGFGAGGFAVTRLIEWHPSALDLAQHPEWSEFDEHPSFLLLRGDRLDLVGRVASATG